MYAAIANTAQKFKNIGTGRWMVITFAFVARIRNVAV